MFCCDLKSGQWYDLINRLPKAVSCHYGLINDNWILSILGGVNADKLYDSKDVCYKINLSNLECFNRILFNWKHERVLWIGHDKKNESLPNSHLYSLSTDLLKYLIQFC